MTRISNPLAIPLLIQLLRQGEAAQAEAKAANEARRDDIVKGRTDTRGRVLDQWKGYGESLTADTNQGYDKNLNNSLAALQNSGLGQSTVNSSIRSRNETERQNALRRVKDDITSNYANTDERLSNNIDEFKERIVDQYPDNSSLNSITALLGQLMGNGGLGGFGGSVVTVAAIRRCHIGSKHLQYRAVTRCRGPRLRFPRSWIRLPSLLSSTRRTQPTTHRRRRWRQSCRGKWTRRILVLR